MKQTGAFLARYALEQIGVKFTFGIPGVHNTELYDELNKSDLIQPVLVTHECGGAFMAEAISRTHSSIGCLVIVPAAGVTHALSGIGEAYLDGIPLLVISGGIRRDTGRHYQLHQLDQQKLVAGITKQAFLVERYDDIIPVIYEAFRVAREGTPGPVLVEIPVNVQLFRGEVEGLPPYREDQSGALRPTPQSVALACDLLQKARHPGLFLGWGAVDAHAESIALAELLNAPVATTLQGLSAFPASHPLHTGMGFGAYSVPAGEKAFANCDLLIAAGARFGEIPTGSFGMRVPEALIHIDLNPEVFHKNYPATLTITADAKATLGALAAELHNRSHVPPAHLSSLSQLIKEEKAKYRTEWAAHTTPGRVNPALFFKSLRERLRPADFLVVDDGNHTFLAEELFPVYAARRFISPTDFNCMGYAVPGAIGVKLAHPDHTVAAVVGDGAFLMTGLEILTATTLGLGIVFFVFYDGELSQISQGQEIPYNRKTCTVLGDFKLKGIADATGAAYVAMDEPGAVDGAMTEAFQIAAGGRPVIVDVRIDYSKRTRFTSGVVKINLGRFPLGEKFRFVGRALLRRITG